jgi:hypothetical protein
MLTGCCLETWGNFPVRAYQVVLNRISGTRPEQRQIRCSTASYGLVVLQIRIAFILQGKDIGRSGQIFNPALFLMFMTMNMFQHTGNYGNWINLKSNTIEITGGSRDMSRLQTLHHGLEMALHPTARHLSLPRIRTLIRMVSTTRCRAIIPLSEETSAFSSL